MDFPQRYKSHCPSASPCSPVLPSSYRDPLRTIHQNPRVAKTTFHQHTTSIHRHVDHLHQFIYDNTHDAHGPHSSGADQYSVDLEGPTQQERQHHQHLSPGTTRLRSHSPTSPRMRSAAAAASGPRKLSVCSGPRSSERLPSLFAQMKAKLEAPKRPTIPIITTSSLSPIRATNLSFDDDDMYPSVPLSPLHPLQPIPDDNHYRNGQYWSYHSPNPTPTLFGIACSTAGQRAYSNTNPDIERSFRRLQHEDSGRVEHRTIAFSTHLTISRWEPATASTTTTMIPITAADESRVESGNLHSKSLNDNLKSHSPSPHTSPSPKYRQQQPQPQQPNSDPISAARLMSLANYIRHVISLSSGNSQLHSQLALVMQQQQQQHAQRQQKMQGNKSSPYPLNGGAVGQDRSSSLPSPLSAGPGPIKSTTFSTRRHRHLSEYHDYQTRRQMHHHQQQGSSQGRLDVEQQHHQQGHAHLGSIEMQAHRLPSPTSPRPYINVHLTQQQQQQQQHVNAVSPVSTIKPFSPLLKAPFANLTLTLALIYVDRLKAKNPEAKGEPGCSHRLFLVAYIIAAKYRCSIELAALFQEYDDSLLENNGNEDHHHHRNHDHLTTTTASQKKSMTNNNMNGGTSPKSNDQSDTIEKRLLEAQSHAELIFSNHEWVRLLSLGSFFRPPPSSTSSASTTTANSNSVAATARTSPNQPMIRSIPSSSEPGCKPEPKPLPIQSTESKSITHCDTKASSTANHNFVGVDQDAPMLTPVTPSTATSVSSPSLILQVEDLDRMETEFLTFLEFDLSTRSRDLDTCWNLLVGNKEL